MELESPSTSYSPHAKEEHLTVINSNNYLTTAHKHFIKSLCLELLDTYPRCNVLKMSV